MQTGQNGRHVHLHGSSGGATNGSIEAYDLEFGLEAQHPQAQQAMHSRDALITMAGRLGPPPAMWQGDVVASPRSVVGGGAPTSIEEVSNAWKNVKSVTEGGKGIDLYDLLSHSVRDTQYSLQYPGVRPSCHPHQLGNSISISSLHHVLGIATLQVTCSP
jgi:hypothetical protein